MDVFTFQNSVVRKVLNENQDIIELINELIAKKQQQDKAQKRQILEKIYRNIDLFASNIKDLPTPAPEPVIVDTWRSLLNTIRAFMRFPSGDFPAARMCLYFGSELITEESAPLYELCTEADDVLLEALRRVWKRGGQTEFFNWVFKEYQIHKPIMYSDIEVATALSPEELAMFPRQKGTEIFVADELFTGPFPRWDLGDEMEGRFCTCEGSDGPIREEIQYMVYTEHNNDDSDDSDDDEDDDGIRYHHIQVFRRSRQFCFDAQQIAEANLGNQRFDLLNKIVIRHGVPRELQLQILSYMSYREPFPYLKNLDIGKAYVPFPSVNKRCLVCEDLDEKSTFKRTCPQASLYIWNLALRRFHVFHKNDFNTWSLCSHGSDCKGHHACSDHGWVVLRDPDFSLFIEKEAAKGNDEFLSLDQVGFGPAEPIRVHTRREDLDRKWQLLSHGIYYDTTEDWLMTGGLGGLIDSMLHGRVLVGARETDVDSDGDSDINSDEDADDEVDEDGMTSVPAQWAVGVNLLAQNVGENAIKEQHSWPGRCEWCG
ncbi:hypothetical protein IL306_008977 [Fusarium sp. DS 682]|nr:hypothetical protein IL306_008977 [Fusarium sp. DS 682]